MSIIPTYFLYQIVENCMISQSLDYLVKKPLKMTLFIDSYEVSTCNLKLQTWIKTTSNIPNNISKNLNFPLT